MLFYNGLNESKEVRTMENPNFKTPEIPRDIAYQAAGRTALELLAQPFALLEARGPQPTPPLPFETSPRPTPPDHTGYPDVSPPDQEFLGE